MKKNWTKNGNCFNNLSRENAEFKNQNNKMFF